MDQLKGALGSFGGENNERQQDGQQGGQQGGQEAGIGGMLSSFTGGNNQQGSQQGGGSGGGSGGILGSLGDKFNSAAGGGKESEANEDYLDKGVDIVQERFMGQGKQDNESAVEQAKDEQISDFIRSKYKSTTGSDFPVEDKQTRLG